MVSVFYDSFHYYYLGSDPDNAKEMKNLINKIISGDCFIKSGNYDAKPDNTGLAF